jgi:hypothetical protein
MSSYFHALAAMRHRKDEEVDLESMARAVGDDELPHIKITRVKQAPTAPRPSRRVYGQIALIEIRQERWAAGIPSALEIVGELAHDPAFVAQFESRLSERGELQHTVLTEDRDPYAFLADRVIELLTERAMALLP